MRTICCSGCLSCHACMPPSPATHTPSAKHAPPLCAVHAPMPCMLPMPCTFLPHTPPATLPPMHVPHACLLPCTPPAAHAKHLPCTPLPCMPSLLLCMPPAMPSATHTPCHAHPPSCMPPVDSQTPVKTLPFRNY